MPTISRTFDFYVIEPPAAMPVSLPAVKRQVRLEVSEDFEDDLLNDYIEAAAAYWERETESALMLQTLEIAAESFPSSSDIILPRPPFKDIVHVKYDDPQGVEQTWEDYEVNDRSRIAVLRPKRGKTYPQTDQTFNAARIRYRAGYENEAAVPANVKQGLLLLITHWYEHRLPLDRGANLSPYAHALDSIIRQASLPRLGW